MEHRNNFVIKAINRPTNQLRITIPTNHFSECEDAECGVFQSLLFVLDSSILVCIGNCNRKNSFDNEYARYGLDWLSVSSLNLFVSDDKLYYIEMLSNGKQISFLQ